MLGNLILFAAIAATSLHQGESKKIRMDLGSVLKGEVRILKVDCNGPCNNARAKLETSSGSTSFYAAQDFPPFLIGSKCSNCFCQEKSSSQKAKCQQSNLKSDNFFLTVFAYSNSSGVTVIVRGPNVESCNVYNPPSLVPPVLDLGYIKEGERRNFNITCNGQCNNVNVSMKVTYGLPELYLAKLSLPHLSSYSSCENCFCAEVGYGQVNSCLNISLDSTSFGVSLKAFYGPNNSTLIVEGPNFKRIREIAFPSKTLNLGTAKKGDRRYFNATCHGSCGEVYAYAASAKFGNPELYLAKHSLPNLGAVGASSCTNCFCEAVTPFEHNFCDELNIDSSSFGLAVEAYNDLKKATVTVEGPNFKGLVEISVPSQRTL